MDSATHLSTFNFSLDSTPHINSETQAQQQQQQQMDF